MSDLDGAIANRVSELRRAFDESFAAPTAADLHETIDFISIRLGEDPHAIRMTDIAGLFAEVKVTPCPSPIAELRGIAGFRGALTPVYDLAALLGYPPTGGRWLVLAKGGTLAFAFDGFDGHFRVEPEAIAADQGAGAGRHIREIARENDRAWPVIDIPSIVAAIRRRLPQPVASKE